MAKNEPGWHDIESTEGPMAKPTYCDTKINFSMGKPPKPGRLPNGGQDFLKYKDE